MLRVVVAAPPVVVEPAGLAALPACADLIELRLDLLPGALDPDRLDDRLAEWMRASPRPVLATVRSSAEGGGFRGGPEAAARHLEAAARAGAAWLDVEATVAPCLRDVPKGVRLLASSHVEAEPRWPSRVVGRAIEHRKVARVVEDADGLARIRDEARSAGARTSVVPYGPLGAIRGAFVAAEDERLLFGSAGEGDAVVAGQPSLVALLDELRAGEVTPDAALFGLLGRPPTRSPSPAIHDAVFRALDRDALYVPLADLSMEAALRLPFAGFSVTTPFKTEAARRAGSWGPEVEATGAANTLVRRTGGTSSEGAWHARNTDVDALLESLPAAGRGEGAFVYGTGGFARAAVHALRVRGYEARLGGRDGGDGPKVARALGVRWGGPAFVRSTADRVVVNTTPLGVDGAPPPAFGDADLAGLTVLDAPYAEDDRPTGLVALARAGGAERVVPGLDLLAAQAVAQARLFSPYGDLDPDRLRRLVRFALRPRPSLVLVGLRGAGKTSVGRLVARRLGRPFADLDEDVFRATGRTAGAWIREAGVDAFRRVESQAVERLRGRRGVVVATGGGVLDVPANGPALRDGAFAAWLEVEPEVAVARVAGDPTERPALLPGRDPVGEARDLLHRRGPAWKSFAHERVRTDASMVEVANRVVAAWLAYAGA